MDNHQPPLEEDKKLVYRVARMTRMLRNSMKELEVDEGVVRASELIPDARERLNYVATMTEQAADRTLNAVGDIKPLQAQVKQRADALQLLVEQGDDEKVREIGVEELKAISSAAGATEKQLMEIVMAQDYQDLTGQVIKRLMDVIHDLENELVAILLEHVEESRQEEIRESIKAKRTANGDDNAHYLNGPVIESGSSGEKAASQEDVDDLLDAFDL